MQSLCRVLLITLVCLNWKQGAGSDTCSDTDIQVLTHGSSLRQAQISIQTSCNAEWAAQSASTNPFSRLQFWPAAQHQHKDINGSNFISPIRKLLQQLIPIRPSSRPAVPQCLWNEVREACVPTQLAYLAVNAKPATVYHRAATVAYDRNLVCSGHLDAVRCNKDTRNRCMYWNKSCVGMDAYELVNWIGGDTLNGAATTAAFTCPGTAAAEYRTCLTATDAGADGICNQLPNCHWVKMLEACVPTSWDNMSLKQIQDIKIGFETLSASVWGSCAAACYIRQAASCQQSHNASASCQQKPYCVWDVDAFDGRKVCMHRDTISRGTDAYSREAGRMKSACNQQKTLEGCESLKVVPINVGMYRNAQVSSKITTEKATRCLL